MPPLLTESIQITILSPAMIYLSIAADQPCPRFTNLFYIADPDLHQNPAFLIFPADCPSGPCKTSQFAATLTRKLRHSDVIFMAFILSSTLALDQSAVEKSLS